MGGRLLTVLVALMAVERGVRADDIGVRPAESYTVAAAPVPGVAEAAPRKVVEESTKFPWKVSATFDLTSYRKNRTDWYEYRTSFQHGFGTGSISVEMLKVRRFDVWDDAEAVEVWKDLWNHAYVNARVQVTRDRRILPRADLYAELYQGVGRGWELSGSCRHMDFPDGTYDGYGLMIGKYIGRWYLRVKGSQSANTGGRGISGSAWARYYLTDENYLELGGSSGNEVISLGRRGIDIRRSWSLSMRGEVYLTRNVGLSASVGLGDEETVSSKMNFGLSLNVRW